MIILPTTRAGQETICFSFATMATRQRNIVELQWQEKIRKNWRLKGVATKNIVVMQITWSHCRNSVVACQALPIMVKTNSRMCILLKWMKIWRKKIRSVNGTIYLGGGVGLGDKAAVQEVRRLPPLSAGVHWTLLWWLKVDAVELPMPESCWAEKPDGQHQANCCLVKKKRPRMDEEVVKEETADIEERPGLCMVYLVVLMVGVDPSPRQPSSSSSWASWPKDQAEEYSSLN